MNVKEFYEKIGGNYDLAKSRMLSDERIKKYLMKFSSYSSSERLKKAVEDKKYPDIFAITHNLKGMCLNLELTPLAKSSSELCEAVRHGEPSVDIVPLYKAVCSDYEKVVIAISELIA